MMLRAFPEKAFIFLMIQAGEESTHFYDKIGCLGEAIANCVTNYYCSIQLNQVPSILCKILPHLSPFIEYCANNKLSIRKYNNLISTNSTFKHFLDDCLKKHNLSHGLGLGSYLLKPMQRLTKLRLLFIKIFKEFHPHCNEYLVLVEVVNNISQICNLANESAKICEYEFLSTWLERKIYHKHDRIRRTCINSQTEFMGKRKLLHLGILKLVLQNIIKV
ncbi:hypothetical protein MXB_3289, partial [Myxobolus squamalis]